MGEVLKEELEAEIPEWEELPVEERVRRLLGSSSRSSPLKKEHGEYGGSEVSADQSEGSESEHQGEDIFNDQEEDTFIEWEGAPH